MISNRSRSFERGNCSGRSFWSFWEIESGILLLILKVFVFQNWFQSKFIKIRSIYHNFSQDVRCQSFSTKPYKLLAQQFIDSRNLISILFLSLSRPTMIYSIQHEIRDRFVRELDADHQYDRNINLTAFEIQQLFYIVDEQQKTKTFSFALWSSFARARSKKLFFS